MTQAIRPYDLDDIATDVEDIRNILTCLCWWLEEAPSENTPHAESRGKAAAFASGAPVYRSVLCAAMAIAKGLQDGIDAALEKEGQA